MKWFYAEDKKPIGPLDEDAFHGSIRNGTIADDTLVWRSGMEEWVPLSKTGIDIEAIRKGIDQSDREEMIQEAVDVEAEPVSKEEVEAITAGTEPDEEERTETVSCSGCGRYFSPEHMKNIDGRWFCESCEPEARAKPPGKKPPEGYMNYAGFWIRGGAKIIDVILLWIIGIALAYILQTVMPPGDDPESALMFASVLNLMQLAAAATYTTYFLGKFSATPGKMACGLRVVTPEGGPIGYPRACGRYFAEILSSLLFCVGYAIAIIDNEHRTLHDRIVKTRVIII